MRIWGWILFILGIVFLLLFALAEFGGGHIGYIPFFVAGFLVVMGWNLRTSGKGILQTKSAATAEHTNAQTATASGQIPAAPAAEFSTVELPLTPDVAALIARQSGRTRKIVLYTVTGFLVGFAALGAVLGATDHTGNGNAFLLVFSGVGVGSVIMIYGIFWLSSQRAVNRDLRGTNYLRTTGPVQVVSMPGGGMLRLADRAFMIDRRYGMTELSRLGWGRVDYSPHGHVILAAWDREGRSVYCIPGYSAGS
jgi:hypothetical protein